MIIVINNSGVYKMGIIEQYIEYERLYAINGYYGNKINNRTYKIERGSVPILLSAPHSVRQVRNKIIKAQDMYTGAIVDYIQYKTNCYSITNICTDNNDPNYDNINVCKYKQQICKLIEQHGIKLILDIHGLGVDKKSSIDICTNNGKTLNNRDDILEYIIKHLSKRLEIDDKTISLNKYYKADLEFCIANSISKLYSIPIIELEINKILRDPYNYSDNVVELLSMLEYIIRNIKYSKEDKL